MPGLSSSTRTEWFKALYRTCGERELFPRALEVQIQYDQKEPMMRWGGYGDVWKGRYQGRDVAVKVIRIYTNDLLPKIIKVCFLSHFIPAHHVPTPVFRSEIL
jgi:hypothetical protein